MENALNMSEPRKYDVVILGASVCGLAAGAVLAHRGYKVAVLDPLDQAGGRTGAVEYQGHWINWGHRDAVVGLGDMGLPTNSLEEIEAELGITLQRDPMGWGKSMRIHTLPDGVVDVVGEAAISGGEVTDELDIYRSMVRGFVDGGDRARLDKLAAEVKTTLAHLGSIDDQTAWQLVPVTLAEWCTRRGYSQDLSAVLFNFMEQNGAPPGEETSVGRLIFHLRSGLRAAMNLDDDKAGGMQAVVQQVADLLLAKGGELWLGWKPREITIDQLAVQGVVAVNNANLVQEFDTRVVISTYFGWDLPKLIDENLLPDTFLDQARNTQRYSTDVVSWVASCHRMPKIRSTGAVETFRSWQRTVMRHGAKKVYFGGFFWPSMFHKKSAPAGKHQLFVTIPRQGVKSYASWKEAKAAVDLAIDYVHSFYADLDEVIEWSRYQWVEAPQTFNWYLKPCYRHPIKVGSIQGLYSAGPSAEGTYPWLDIEAGTALEAANLLEAEWGETLKAARRG